MASRPDTVPNRRAIIDRRALADTLAERMAAAGDFPGAARRAGGGAADGARRWPQPNCSAGCAKPRPRGSNWPARRRSSIDQLLRILFDAVVTSLYPATNRTSSERLTLVAVGGYGRGQMAPFSDIDLLFLTPWKQTAWGEQVIETMLYLLWDMGLKVGHATRSLDDMVRMARADVTIRTALLESRYVWGDQPLYEEATLRFRKDVVAGTAKAFTAEKLAERDERHKKMGDSRYVVEPNLKEGKGGLRDLHTLFWIGKYAYQVETRRRTGRQGAVDRQRIAPVPPCRKLSLGGAHQPARYRRPRRGTADLRCPARAGEPAALCRTRSTGGMSAVERFMRHYFLIAKTVGDLTGLFLAHLDESFAKASWLPTLTRRPSQLNGFTLRRGQIGVPSDDFFAPIRCG